MMKITVIGAGVQGSTIASFLTKSPEVAEINCSDISLDRVRSLTKKLESDKISARRVDAANVDELLKATKGADVVINAALPKYNLKIMDAALKSGAHYVDLATDTPVKTCILKELELSRKWEDAGLTAVINQGGPFVMDVLARYAADKLDKVDSIRLRFGWRRITKEKEIIHKWAPGWSPEVALLEWSSEPVIYENGKFKDLPMFSELEEYKFPDPLGPVTLSLIEYEPVFTLPRFIGKGVKYVDCKIGLDLMVAALIKMGFASEKPLEVKGAKVTPKDFLLALVPPPVEDVDKIQDRIATGEMEALGCYIAEIQGEENGEKVTYSMVHSYSLSEVCKKFGAAWAEVAVPAVTTATMLAKGEIKTKGVIPPEGLEPKPFLTKLAKKGMTFQEHVIRGIQV